MPRLLKLMIVIANDWFKIIDQIETIKHTRREQ
jgi:hypothetical protein